MPGRAQNRIGRGQGDGSGLRAVDSKVGRIGQLACWEHNNPLARYAMMADGEQIHSAMYPGSMFGNPFAQKSSSAKSHYFIMVPPAPRFLTRILVLFGYREICPILSVLPDAFRCILRQLYNSETQ